jgi:hypothetical protein
MMEVSVSFMTEIGYQIQNMVLEFITIPNNNTTKVIGLMAVNKVRECMFLINLYSKGNGKIINEMVKAV